MENPPLFYLSYARANDSHLVRRFFDDLSTTIGDYLNQGKDLAGFYEEAEYQQTSEWSDAAAEALQYSLTMVCLLSPAYLRTERAGKEWQVFKKRRQFDPGRPKLSDVIVPVSWISCPGPIPSIVSEVLAHPDHIYQKRSMMEMFRSSTMFLGEYAEFVKALASQIIETRAAKKLRPSDVKPTMSAIDTAFQLWEGREPVIEEARNRSNDQKVDFTPVEPPNERVTNSSEANVAISSSQTQSASQTETQIKKYSVLAISRDKDLLEEIEQCCLFSPYFDLRPYEDPKRALRHINTLADDDNLPELFIVDLDLDTQDLKIIAELRDRMTPEMIGLAGNSEPSLEHDLIVPHAILPKPLDSLDELIVQMQRFAGYGRDRAAHERKTAHDDSWKREVFLSFSSKDKIQAMHLRGRLKAAGIEVGYSKDIQEGKTWMEEIETWIGDAQVFVALISNHYLTSKYCKGELISFHQRLKTVKSDRLIPIYYNSPDVAENKFIKEFVHRCQHLTMAKSDHIDRTNVLVKRIKNVLGR